MVPPTIVDVACDGVDYVYALCSLRTIRKYSLTGAYLGEVGATGIDAGHTTAPRRLAIGPGGSLYVADPGRGEVVIFDREGRWIRSLQVSLDHLVDLAVNTAGHLYVAETSPDLVRHRDAAGKYIGDIVMPASLPANASLTSRETRLSAVGGVACDGADRIYVTDYLWDRVFVFSPDDAPLGIIGRTGSEPGQFWKPGAIHAGADGRVALWEDANQRVQVLTPRGTP